MKRLTKALLILLLPTGVFGQQGVAELLNSGLSDINNLTKMYIEPFGKSFGTAMNSGWFYTARPHKLFGFDLTLNTSLVNVPSASQMANLNDYTWNHVTFSQSTTPTISGKGPGTSVGLRLSENGNEYKINNLYKLPDGGGISFIPLPMVQFGIGLPKGTDVMFRYFPKLSIGDVGEIGMMGFGIRHDIKQWIPVVNKLPFDMSVQGGWSRLTGSYSNINYFPTTFIASSTFDYIDYQTAALMNDESGLAGRYYRSQSIDLTTTAWNVNLLVSKKLLFVTGYAGIGYAKSSFNLGLKGKYLIPNYSINVTNDTNGDGIYSTLDRDNEIEDPIDVTIDYGSVNMTVGLRIQLAVISIHAAYVYQDYAMYNFGLGISLR